MATIIQALLPVIFTIVLGWLLRRGGRLSDRFCHEAEHIVYYILTPALLIAVLAERPLTALPWQKLLLIIAGTLLACALLLTLWQLRVRRLQPACFTSLFQGGLRYNTFIALALAASLLGDEGLRYSALAATLMILLINVLCLSAFSLSATTPGSGWRGYLLQLVANPLIIGCSIGLLLNLTSVSLPPALISTLDLLGRAAFPVALLLVGAALNFRGIFGNWELTLTASVMQFLIKPLLALLLIELTGLTGTAAMVTLIFFCVPTAPSAYILARQLGGNAQAMATIITVQTVVAAVTLPLTLYLVPVL